MAKIKIGNALKAIGKILNKNKPQILTGVGLGLSISSTVLACRATVDAVRIYDKETENAGRPLTKKETVKACWKPYIYPIVAEAGAVTSIVGGQKAALTRLAGATAAEKLVRAAYTDLVNNTRKELGDEKANEIINKTPQPNFRETAEVYIPDDTKVIFVDSLSNRTFKAKLRDVDEAFNRINSRINTEMYVSVAELYQELGLNAGAYDDYRGWYSLIDHVFKPTFIGDDYTLAIEINYSNMPVTNFREKGCGYE